MENANPPHHPHHRRRRPSLFWPLFLIAVGIILLLSNMGILPPNSIDLLWRFWPLALVILGIDILVGRRSAVGSFITSVIAILLLGGVLGFIFVAQNMPELVQYIDLGNLKHETIHAPLDNVKSASVVIDWPGSPARLYALSDSNALIEGDINYYGTLYFQTDTKGNHATINIDSRIEQFFISTGGSINQNPGWEIGLHPGVTLDLTLDAGSGPGTYDFEKLDVESFNIDAGSGPISLALPARGQVSGFINAGSGLVNISLPETMQAKITVDKGSGPFNPGQRFHQARASDGNRTVWLTNNFEGADNYIELEIDQGSGPVRVR